MARVTDNEYTFLNDREIAATGIGSSPSAVQAYGDLQRAVYELGPADTADAQNAADGAQASADVADEKAAGAQTAAEAADTKAADAQTAAEDAGTRADAAQTRADDAYDLAGEKVTKNVGPVFAASLASESRAALPAYVGGTAGAVYTIADMQAVMDQVAALTSRVAALIIDGRANQSLTN
ncbi:hypothetical protein [Sphingomonas albertensis]|uniref:hypothetical protein n=1 Tax=Sphingomonas albertensis TaxID=2762591 RepID=UPI0037D9CF36